MVDAMTEDRTWSDEQLLSLVRLFDQGLTDGAIGKRIGKTRAAVRNKRVKMGMYRESHGRPSDQVQCSLYKKPIVERRADDVKMRKCLGTGCGRMFKSSWIGNRLCPSCKSRG